MVCVLQLCLLAQTEKQHDSLKKMTRLLSNMTDDSLNSILIKTPPPPQKKIPSHLGIPVLWFITLYNITEFINENTFFEIIWRLMLKKNTVLGAYTYTYMLFFKGGGLYAYTWFFTSCQSTLKWPNVPDIVIKFDKNIYSRSLRIQEILVAYVRIFQRSFKNLLIYYDRFNGHLWIFPIYFSHWFFASSYWLIALYSILT